MGIGRNLTASFDKSEAIYQEPAQKLHVIGNIISTGTITSSYSDERLKTFTSNISNSLDIINNLSGYHYVPNKLAIDNGFTSEKEIGLNAQEVEKVLPEIVKLAPFDTVRDSEGNIISKSRENYLTICYERMAPVFVEAIKELARENKALREENSAIKEDLRKIKLALGL
jgi:chaperonin cofactor prefoldin